MTSHFLLLVLFACLVSIVFAVLLFRTGAAESAVETRGEQVPAGRSTR